GGDAWAQISPARIPPAAGPGHSAIYDPVRSRMVVFGGYSYSGSEPLNDTWVLSLAGNPSWGQLTPGATPPSGRSQHSAVYDSMHDRMVVFGGYNGVAYLNDLWVMDSFGDVSVPPLDARFR